MWSRTEESKTHKLFIGRLISTDACLPTGKIKRAELKARWLCFLIRFFDRNDLTDFHDFWHP